MEVTMKNGVFWALRRVALVRTDVSQELGVSFNKVARIGELGTTLALTSNRRTLRRNTKFSEMSVLTRATRRNIPEEAILQIQLNCLPFRKCFSVDSLGLHLYCSLAVVMATKTRFVLDLNTKAKVIHVSARDKLYVMQITKMCNVGNTQAHHTVKN
jgi:hypothetical protein